MRPGPDRVWCLGDLVGYGAHPDGCVETARERCDVNLAGNHDLGRARPHRHRRLRPSRRAGGALDPPELGARDAELPGDAEPQPRRRGDRPVPRLAPRSDLGVRAVGRPGLGLHGRHGAARVGHRPHARGVLLQPHRRGDGGRPGGSRYRAEHRRRGVAAEPRQRGPTARRRPTGGLAPARRGAVDRDMATDGVPGGARPRTRSWPPACPPGWANGSTWGNDLAPATPPGRLRGRRPGGGGLRRLGRDRRGEAAPELGLAAERAPGRDPAPLRRRPGAGPGGRLRGHPERFLPRGEEDPGRAARGRGRPAPRRHRGELRPAPAAGRRGLPGHPADRDGDHADRDAAARDGAAGDHPAGDDADRDHAAGDDAPADHAGRQRRRRRQRRHRPGRHRRRGHPGARGGDG